METPNPRSFEALEPARTWESHSFHEVLAGQIRKAPYLLASLTLHALAALALAGWIFLQRGESSVPGVTVAAPISPPEIEEIEPEKPVVQEEAVPEPTINEIEALDDQPELTEEIGDPENFSKDPFDHRFANNDIGVGGNPGGDWGIRARRGPSGRPQGSPTEKAVADALVWLASHQSPEGYWDCDEFMYEDKFPDHPHSDGPGNPVNDVGVTGLALLAFLGHGNTLQDGEYRDTVRRGVNWLRSVQQENGLFGEEVGNPTLYNHSIATMAYGEAYYFTGGAPNLRRPMKKAVDLIVAARNEYGAWRYSLEPNGDNDSSITGWTVFALKTAEDAGIPVSHDNYAGALAWFDNMTDPASGRTGYATGEGGGPGSRPSRPLAEIQRFPPERSEALTAVSLLCRIFLSDLSRLHRWQEHEDWLLLKKQAELCLRTPPQWDPEGGACDLYYWYYANFAMNQLGDPYWRQWKAAMQKALLPSQRKDGNFNGSWNPAGPWGEDGGRVYSTAICTLMLEVTYRYSRLLGAR